MTRLTPRLISTVFLIAIMALYGVVSVLFAVRTPAWQTPDEPAHYNYIQQVAENGCCPIIEDGDWDQAYLSELTSARFADSTLARLEGVQYEDHQPPLYYVIMSPVYTLTGGDLVAMRIASAAFGLVIIVAAFGVGRVMFPQRPEIGLSAAAFVAFLPQHVAILASVNNDALGWALVAVMLWMCAAYAKGSTRITPLMMGIVMGAALVTKATAYLMGAVILLAVLLRWRRDRQPVARLIRDAALYLVPALGIGALWWVRNFGVYGFPDFLGLAAHDAVVVGQLRTETLIADLGLGGYLSEALTVTLSSFIGRFGWMALPLVGNPSVDWIYPAYVGLFILAMIGNVIGLARREITRDGQRGIWLMLTITSLLAVLAYLYYNTEFAQFQGRYMYPLLIPLGIFLAVGLDQLRRMVAGRWAASRWVIPALWAAFAALDVWLIITIIPPNLAPL